MDYDEIVRFHGHKCPGLAMGYRMACAGMRALSEVRSEDEGIVAIVENNACGVDALQCVTGCTFGKGNLLFHDYGKQVYTLFSHSSGKGVRVSFHGKEIPDEARQNVKSFSDFILNAQERSLLTITSVTISEPEHARILRSVPCDECDEPVMETRVRHIDNKTLCIPCAQKRGEAEQASPH